MATYGIAPAAGPAAASASAAASRATSGVGWRMAAPWRRVPARGGGIVSRARRRAERRGWGRARPASADFAAFARGPPPPSPCPTPPVGSRVADDGPSHQALVHRRPAPQPPDGCVPLARRHPAPDLADDLGHRGLLRGHRELVRHPVRRHEPPGPARLHRAVLALLHPRERLPLLPRRPVSRVPRRPALRRRPLD